MAKKRIKWSSRANYELKEILEYYNMRNGTVDYSLRLLTEINDIVNTLSQSAFIGRLTEKTIKIGWSNYSALTILTRPEFS